MLDLTDPSHNGSDRSCPYVANNASASIGSPNRVPVPCASTASTSEVDRPADANASRIPRCCDGPFGAVKPFDAPSWFTALPRTTASTSCPRACASDNRSSTRTPAPSDQPVPSAPAPNALQRPSGESPRCRENSTNRDGVAITVVPPASASSHSRRLNVWHARCSATSDEEHAVSTDTAGPSSPNVYARRPDATLGTLPVSRKPSSSCGGRGPMP